MKRLLLASSGSFVTDGKVDPALREGRGDFFGMRREDLRWAYIITASKDVPDDEYVNSHKAKMEQSGFNYKEVDIDNKTEEQVREELKDVDVIYVEGGNTFYLLKAIRACNFEKIIREKLAEGVVYVGTSAGSYVACPSIEMATWKDPPATPARSDGGQGEIRRPIFNRHGITDFTAMNLVSFLVFAHYEDMYKELLQKKTRGCSCNVKILNDEQAIRVKDENVELVGDPVEIVI